MPPWHVDRTIGIQQFKDDPSLSDQEIATIAKWADSGAPQGNLSDMPPARQFADGNSWQIGEPDLIIKFPKYRVPAEGPDWYGDLYADIPIDEDRYIKAIQTRSATQASHRVVHHALSYSQDAPTDNGTMPVDGGQFLVEYAQGKNAEVYPDGTGVLLKAGDKARVSYHTHSYGEDTQMEIELGMVQQRILMASAVNQFVFSCTPKVKSFLLHEGTDPKYGARHLKRAIERHIVFQLANLVATGQIKLGDFIRIDMSAEGTLMFVKEAENAMVPMLLERQGVAAGALPMARPARTVARREFGATGTLDGK